MVKIQIVKYLQLGDVWFGQLQPIPFFLVASLHGANNLYNFDVPSWTGIYFPKRLWYVCIDHRVMRAKNH